MSFRKNSKETKCLCHNISALHGSLSPAFVVNQTWHFIARSLADYWPSIDTAQCVWMIEISVKKKKRKDGDTVDNRTLTTYITPNCICRFPGGLLRAGSQPDLRAMLPYLILISSRLRHAICDIYATYGANPNHISSGKWDILGHRSRRWKVEVAQGCIAVKYANINIQITF